jgi:hypothetical protein
MLRRFMIEREIPGIGLRSGVEMGEVARVSNQALARMTGVQWQHSYVGRDRTFCIYLADGEEALREHARLSGFPISRIVELPAVIDPATERQAAREAAQAQPAVTR